jgi:hypothetical protein
VAFPTGHDSVVLSHIKHVKINLLNSLATTISLKNNVNVGNFQYSTAKPCPENQTIKIHL